MPFLLISLLSISLAMTLLILLSLAYNRFKSTRKRTAPSDLTPSPHKFPFSSLRRATASFSGDNRVGQGGFGSVYRGVLDSGQLIAVKLMSEASTQGEFEFQNELSLASSIDAVCCPYLVSVIGFSTDDEFRLRRRRRRRRVRRLALVYEFMENGSLQDALLDRKCVELMNWKKRFEVIMCVAKGIEYLHNECVPAVVHGDIKPSNVLLDSNFDAKIADFGLAQVVREEEAMIVEENGVEKSGENDGKLELGESDEVVVNVDESPESFCVRIVDEEVGSVLSEDSVYRKGNAGKSESKRDWWWKQESVGGVSESGRVKDYVMEWIGSEINKEERSKKDWGLVKSASSVVDGGEEKRKKLEWWGSLDRETFKKEKKSREPKEWWKEEFCEELCRKKKKKARGSEGEMWWQKDEVVMPEKKRRRSRGSRSSIDVDFRMGRRHSQDWTNGDIPKSGGISSTPSMRGTVCYIAPECGGGAQVSDKCDVYSFGVLLLVLVSGRRPLQVMASPMSEFERANLISWARQLAVNGKLLDLVDSNIQCLDQEQALLCITIGLLCLQRSPNKRPAMKDIVKMLSGKSEPPNLPFEFSPSPPSNYPFKSRRKAR